MVWFLLLSSVLDTYLLVFIVVSESPIISKYYFVPHCHESSTFSYATSAILFCFHSYSKSSLFHRLFYFPTGFWKTSHFIEIGSIKVN